jgi:hypothetical protein
MKSDALGGGLYFYAITKTGCLNSVFSFSIYYEITVIDFSTISLWGVDLLRELDSTVVNGLFSDQVCNLFFLIY